MFVAGSKSFEDIFVLYAEYLLSMYIDFRCLYCDAEFDVQSDLVGHISAIHSSIYPYVCAECGLLCPNESVFSLHQKKFHPYNKGYACKICNRVLVYHLFLFVCVANDKNILFD